MKLPDSWDDIKLFQYIAIRDILKTYNGSIEDKCRLLSILTDKDEEYFLNLPISSLKSIDLDFLTKEIQKDFFTTFKIKGIKFEVQTSIIDFKASTYIDLLNYLKDNGADKNIHKIMALICKPKDGWFQKIKMTKSEIENLFLNQMPITIAYPVAAFFLNFWKNLMPDIEIYLEKTMSKILTKDQMKQLKGRISKTNGGGLLPSMP